MKIYIKKLIRRVLLSVILLLVVLIYTKNNDNNLLNIKKYLFSDSFKFMKINKIYSNVLGNILPNTTNNTKMVFSNDEIKTDNKYLDGIIIDKNEISALCGGIVVYIGNKDDYGNTIIIQGNNGIDYWYGNVEKVNVNLYDYIEKDIIIGNSNNYYYLVLQKDGKIISLDEAKDL